MSATVNVNGRISGERDAAISVFDHGFLYGEGVYETMRTYNGEPFLYDRHMRRLRRSADMIVLDVPLSDAEMADRIAATAAAAALNGSEAYIRVLVTRGIGELTYDPKATPVPSVVIIVKPHVDPPPDAYAKGVKVCLSPILRNHPQSVNPMIKSNNLLNNALAMQEALRRGGTEAIMRNYRGELTECSQSNIFIVKNGAVLTPPVAAGLLPGITREFVMEIARELGIDAHDQTLREDDLFSADESFLTSTTKEIVPIVQVDDHRIGSGNPGPITVQLLSTFRARAASMGAREITRPPVAPQAGASTSGSRQSC
jgi:branched-chain amino acid aminotransferase